MATKEQIHNANLLSQAMRMQDVATKIEGASKMLKEILNLNYEGILEPSDVVSMYSTCEALEKVSARKIHDSLTKQIQ